MAEHPTHRGRIRPAPENFLSEADIAAVKEGRRDFLRKALATASAAVAAPGLARAAEGDPNILTLPPWTTSLGQAVAARPYGLPSQYEKGLQRRESPGLTRMPQVSVAFTPLQGLFGIITPSGLHFERHHQGWSDIDPSRHRLMVHGTDEGFVKQPKVYTMDDILRLPPVSRMHFIECGANTGMEWGNVAVPTVQYSHGMLSCSEFTGVPLRVILEDCGVDWKKAKYVLAEGADGSSMTRTIPMDRALDDVMVAYAMNGEMLRPENGYPLRLVAPGIQGVSWVKYLRRIEVGDKEWATKDEAVHYIDLMPDGRHRQYTSIQECKSVVTSPSGGQTLLDKGFYNVTGLAWSGRGKIKRVDVSFDGGRNWQAAKLHEPVLPKCTTRFEIPWDYQGGGALLVSRAMDETGYSQPTMAELQAVRGVNSIYHNNAQQVWAVAPSGEVENVRLG